MRRTTSHAKSNLFIMEMILCLLFLSLTCSVCIQLFTAAYMDRHKAREWNHIQDYVVTCAEILESWEGTAEDYSLSLQKITGFLPVVEEPAENDPASGSLQAALSLSFDRSWTVLPSSGEGQESMTEEATPPSAYTLHISLERDLLVKTAVLTFTKENLAGEEEILCEQTIRYPAGFVSAAAPADQAGNP